MVNSFHCNGNGNAKNLNAIIKGNANAQFKFCAFKVILEVALN